MSLDTLATQSASNIARNAAVGTSGAPDAAKWVIVTRGIKREYDMGGGQCRQRVCRRFASKGCADRTPRHAHLNSPLNVRASHAFC